MKFYEDPTYIEMCRGAGEIQEQCPDIDDAKSFWIDIENNPYNHNIWLPRLDQLIEMMSEQFETGLMDAHYRFYEWIEKGKWTPDSWCSPWLRYGESYEAMWLAFLMETKHGKRWDFEKKEWVKV